MNKFLLPLVKINLRLSAASMTCMIAALFSAFFTKLIQSDCYLDMSLLMSVPYPAALNS